MDPTFLSILMLTLGAIVGGAFGSWITRLYNKNRTARLEEWREADAEKINWIKESQKNLREAFEALAAKSLRDNADDFSGRINQQLTSHSEHFGLLKQSLDKDINQLDANIRELERKREGAYQSLTQQMVQLQTAHSSLLQTTTQLVAALKSGPVRGRWGEIQLRKVVELAGMTEHVSFLEQVVGSEGRKPDLVVHLPNEGRIAIDSKFPLQAFLEAMEAITDKVRKEKCGEHVKVMKAKILELSKKGYWKEFDPSPELTIMFIPIESCLMVAYEQDPGIIEFALEHKIVLASPVTLLGFMKSIAYGWQQFTISKNARKILVQGKELYNRIETWLEHFRKTGERISATAKSYNDSVASLQTRFFPACRRFQELTAIVEDLEDAETINIGINLPAVPVSAEKIMPIEGR
ncbi:MAG: DNA recombination protein RmuC [Candidatus Nitrosoglobus sp.]